MMLIISVLKALVEIAAMSVVAQLLIGFFSPSTRHNNPIYRFFSIITQPVNAIVRRILPALVLDQHIPLATLFTLLLAWLGLFVLKIQAHGYL